MSDPKKPWEGTWRVSDDRFATRMLDENGEDVLYGEPTHEGNHHLCGDPAALALAAAAPEMYRAIEEILLAFDRGAIPYRTDVCEALDSAEAVLKKARGE